MKRKTVIALSLIMVMLFTSAISVSAAESPGMSPDITKETVYYADGSYATIETTVYGGEGYIQPMATAKLKSSQVMYTYYNGNKKKAWDFTVKGTFQYDGTRVVAKSSSSSYNVYISGWKCASRSTNKSGATVKGTARFEYRGTASKTVTIGMKCSKTGTITAI